MINIRFSTITPLLTMFFIGAAALSAQEPLPDDILPGLKDKAIVLYINTKIVENNKEVIWDSSDSKVTIPGKTVAVKLTGKNIVIVGQFTPYIRADGFKFLVAQGQVWIDIPNEGVHYYTNMQTLPLEYGEQIFFFPLGPQKNENGTRIEIQLVIRPYTENEHSVQ